MTDDADKKRIEALELQNIALRGRIEKLEGAQSVLSKRILSAIAVIQTGNKREIIETVKQAERSNLI